MKRITKFLLVFVISIFTFTTNVFAEDKNEVTLNFEGGDIHDGYVEYSKIGKLQLFKGDDLVANISNNMVIDLNEAEYEFVIVEIEDTGSILGTVPVKLNINNWYYPMTTIVGETKSTFKLESSKFSGALDVKLVRIVTAINTKVENVYDDITSQGTIDLTNGKEYVIDFSKNDELTEGLKLFADLDKTLYYKRDYNGLLLTDNESEAVIKIVGNRSENKAILTAVNVETKKSEVFKGLHTKYTGSKLTYTGSDNNIINETRTDYYTRCTYNFTFQYLEDKVEEKEYTFIEGANQTYTINESDIMTFRIDADYSLFENNGKVYIDNELVDPSNYKSASGSTIITFNKEYADKLSNGEHTLKVVFNDNGEAITKFEIKAKKTNNENSENITNPQTGDNITTYFILSIISVLGIVTSVMINNKKFEN